MSGRLRILDTGLAPARRNVALSAALLRSIDAGGPDTLRFHRYVMSCVVGRNQDVATELDIAACRAGGIEIARRVTGGGAVVMGPGILAFDLVLRTAGRDIHGLTRHAGEALAGALVALGFPAILATPGSIEIGGRKVSGSAGRLGRRAALHQATLILDLADAPPLSLLRRRTEAGKPTADPTHRVTSLAAEAHPPLEEMAIAYELDIGAASSLPLVGRAESKRSFEPGWGGCHLLRARSSRSHPHPALRFARDHLPHKGEGRPNPPHSAICDSPPPPGEGERPALQIHLALAFAEAFDLTPEPGELTAAELALADDIFAREVGRDDYVLENARPMEAAA